MLNAKRTTSEPSNVPQGVFERGRSSSTLRRL